MQLETVVPENSQLGFLQLSQRCPQSLSRQATSAGGAGPLTSQVVRAMLYVVFLQWVFTELGLPIAGSINAYGLNFSVEPRLSLYLGSYIADALCFAAIYPVVAPIVYQVKRDLLAASGPK